MVGGKASWHVDDRVDNLNEEGWVLSWPSQPLFLSRSLHADTFDLELFPAGQPVVGL